MRRAGFLQKKFISDEVRLMTCFFFYSHLSDVVFRLISPWVCTLMGKTNQPHQCADDKCMFCHFTQQIVRARSVLDWGKVYFCEQPKITQSTQNNWHWWRVSGATVCFSVVTWLSWHVCSTGTLDQRKPFRQLTGSPTAAEREQQNQSWPSQWFVGIGIYMCETGINSETPSRWPKLGDYF